MSGSSGLKSTTDRLTRSRLKWNVQKPDNPPVTLYPVKGLTLSLKWNKENKDEKAEMPSHFYVSGIYKCMII